MAGAGEAGMAGMLATGSGESVGVAMSVSSGARGRRGPIRTQYLGIEDWARGEGFDPACQLDSLAAEVALERGEGLAGDVVLDAFGVEGRDVAWDPQGFEEADDDLVALAGALGEGLASVGEEDGAVGACGDEVLIGQARDGPDDGDVGDAQAPGEIGDAGLAAGGDEVGDGFDVVLCDLGGVGAPDFLIAQGGLLGRGGLGRGAACGLARGRVGAFRWAGGWGTGRGHSRRNTTKVLKG